MALVINDRVRETTTVTGTNDATLLGAVTGFQAFSVIGNGNTTYYTISDQSGGNWEVGIGTYSSIGPTLARTTVLSSSAGGSKVSFPAGTKDVFVTYPSEKSVNLDESDYVIAGGSSNIGLNGNLTFNGSARRIIGDWSNATVTNRPAFQTSTTNGATSIFALPNGTGVLSQWIASNNSDPTNAGVTRLYVNNTESRLEAGITGTGTYLPLTFHTNGTEKLRIAADAAGTYTFGGTGPRITGDFTTTARVIFQTNSTNGGTTLLAIPNGASNTAQLQVQNSSSDLVNYSYGLFRVDATTVQVRSDIAGTGTYLPTTFWTGGSERIRINTSGALLIGTTVSPASGAVEQVITGGTSNYLEFISTSGGGGIIGNLGSSLTFFTLTGSIGSEVYTERMRIDGNGLVGIGLNPSGTTVRLQVSTDALISGLTVGKGAAAVATNTAFGVSAMASVTTSATSTAIGYEALFTQSTGNQNTAVGFSALRANTTGFNTAVGSQALRDNTTGGNNTAVGTTALATNTTGASNTAVGFSALTVNTASNNTALGASALAANTTGTTNTAVGAGALATNITGASNTAVGFNALNANTATNNTAFGASALAANTSGVDNNAFGASSLATNTTGSYNVAMGQATLTSLTTAVGNVAMGYATMNGITTGNYNVGIGYGCLTGITNTSGNIGIGQGAGGGLTTGSFNIYIGYGSTASSSAASQELVLSPNPNITGKGNNTGFINVGAAGSVYQGNNSASWATTSDIRIKENVTDVASGLDIITALRPVQFDYILTGQHDTGFIAQEYQKVLPDQVTTHTATGKEVALTGGEDLLAINQNLVPYLVKAIQELKEEVDSLKKQLGK
jgi:hypothetical protein